MLSLMIKLVIILLGIGAIGSMILGLESIAVYCVLSFCTIVIGLGFLDL